MCDQRSIPTGCLLVCLLLAIGIRPVTAQQVQEVIEHTQQHFVPDSRVDIFKVEAIRQADSLVLKGETTLASAKAALLDSLSGTALPIADHIEVLPADELQGKTFALVNNSVANLRSEPAHPAQLSTQTILGMPLRILKKEGNWYLVKTPNDYISWVDGGGLEPMTKKEYQAWVEAPKVIYLKTYGFAYQEPSSASPKASDLVAGNILKFNKTVGSFYQVTYPDGRTGYIHTGEAQPYDEWKTATEPAQQPLVQSAKTMIGVPYLWGGTSTKGVDCSGFTKMIYFMNGLVIPRDASQQVVAGRHIDTSQGFENLQPGDLLFFGRPATNSTQRSVTHVGMWIGNGEFIQSSGRVRISSVNPDAPNYDEFNVNRFLEARRYLHHTEGNIIKTADMYESMLALGE